MKIDIDIGAVMPALHTLLLLASSLSDADLFKVTVTKVLQIPLEVISYSWM